MSFVPVTPGGTIVMWLESDTEDEAWAKLLVDAAHMPYDGKKGFIARGYTVEELEGEL
jgi:hypothetical protein